MTCVDGDATCDADDVAGQCTFRIGMCLNNTDARFPCTPNAISSVVLKGRQAKSAGGKTLVGGLAALASGGGTVITTTGVFFAPAFADANRCTPFDDFVVRRKRRRGVGTLRAVIAARALKDRNTLKLVCLAP